MKIKLLLVLGAVGVLISGHLCSQTLTSSNLPIVILNTSSQNIDVPYQTFTISMGVIDNGANKNFTTDPWNNYNGKATIEVRGSSSMWLPKKSYHVTTIDNLFNELSVPLMGLPAESDWVFKALYQDKSFLRDEITFKIFREMGHYSSRSRFFELVVDGNYQGVYQLEEKIKKNKFRVDIAKCDSMDVSGDDVTGGYIIKLDKFEPKDDGWFSKYMSNATKDSANQFLYHYPKPEKIIPAQKAYIKGFFDQFEDALVSTTYADPNIGYRKYINVPSFIDFFIVNEISKNVDGYRSSTYFYKDKNSNGDGKLHCGPVWDFNLGWYNCAYNGSNLTTGWQYQTTSYMNYIPFWWWQFMNDNVFKNDLKCRYNTLRGSVLKTSNLHKFIDSMAVYLNESQQRNFTRWPIMGTVVEPNPQPVPADYAGEIAALKNWVQQRLSWLDANMPGICAVGVEEQSASVQLIQSFPNPFVSDLHVVYKVPNDAHVKIDLLDILGKPVMTLVDEPKTPGTYKTLVSTHPVAQGSYLLRLNINELVLYQKLIKIEN